MTLPNDKDGAKLLATIRAALSEYRCQRFVDGDESGMTLADVFSAGAKTIEPGNEELDLLADFIASEIEHAPVSSIAPKPPEDVQEWIWHMDLHLTEHDIQHAGKALRAAWPAVRVYLVEAELERDTWKELAKNAESKQNWLRAQRDTAEEKLKETAPSAIAPNFPNVCDGQEQDAFERWASVAGMDMTQHPLHWLFLNAKTCAAREGWKAAIQYVRKAAKVDSATSDDTGAKNG